MCHPSCRLYRVGPIRHGDPRNTARTGHFYLWLHICPIYAKVERVPKIDAFQIAGLDLWFNSADHQPPHFHAEWPDGGEVRVYLLRDPDEMVERKVG
jgi:hypothetical protein